MRQAYRERVTVMEFFAWMLVQQSIGNRVTQRIVECHWKVNPSTAQRWMTDYLEARSRVPALKVRGDVSALVEVP